MKREVLNSKHLIDSSIKHEEFIWNERRNKKFKKSKKEELNSSSKTLFYL